MSMSMGSSGLKEMEQLPEEEGVGVIPDCVEEAWLEEACVGLLEEAEDCISGLLMEAIEVALLVF